MKVLFWTDGFWPHTGGLQTQSFQFIENFQKRDHQCMVLTRKHQTQEKEDETYRGISIKRFAFDTIIAKYELKNIRSIQDYLESLLREFQPDIVHLNLCLGWSTFVFLLFKHLFHIPIVLTLHTSLFDKGKTFPIIEKIVSSVDKICCVSNWAIREIEENLPSIKNKLRLIYNGLLIPEIDPTPLSFSPPTLLLLGRLCPKKGFDTAIQAFSLLKKSNSNARLLIAGEGQERQTLENLVNQLGLLDSVQFTGEVERDKALSLINQATLVIVPSYSELFGLVALEAMQLERPVIASRVGGLQEVISDGETGLLVPPQNPGILYQAIQELLENPEKAIRLGKQGRKSTMEKFTIHQNVVHYENLYKELIQAFKLMRSIL